MILVRTTIESNHILHPIPLVCFLFSIWRGGTVRLAARDNQIPQAWSKCVHSNNSTGITAELDDLDVSSMFTVNDVRLQGLQRRRRVRRRGQKDV